MMNMIRRFVRRFQPTYPFVYIDVVGNLGRDRGLRRGDELRQGLLGEWWGERVGPFWGQIDDRVGRRLFVHDELFLFGAKNFYEQRGYVWPQDLEAYCGSED
jgi:hypothetical protein